MKLSVPKWAQPEDSMSEEELRFAIEAEDVIDFMQRGFRREDHVACYSEEHKERAGKDWDDVVRRLAEETPVGR